MDGGKTVVQGSEGDLIFLDGMFAKPKIVCSLSRTSVIKSAFLYVQVPTWFRVLGIRSFCFFIDNKLIFVAH